MLSPIGSGGSTDYADISALILLNSWHRSAVSELYLLGANQLRKKLLTFGSLGQSATVSVLVVGKRLREITEVYRNLLSRDVSRFDRFLRKQ